MRTEIILTRDLKRQAEWTGSELGNQKSVRTGTGSRTEKPSNIEWLAVLVEGPIWILEAILLAKQRIQVQARTEKCCRCTREQYW